MSMERFMKVYSYLPLEERKLTVLVMDGEPISWARAYKEIRDKTGLGDKILRKMAEKDII
ncbi:MAG: hypothetical protein HYX24_04640 [Candidatus Aenigmarchaeota archaeon]|nr:hypothetical protein [Candidatus Aenigmarchaeota archaeon]